MGQLMRVSMFLVVVAYRQMEMTQRLNVLSAAGKKEKPRRNLRGFLDSLFGRHFQKLR